MRCRKKRKEQTNDQAEEEKSRSSSRGTRALRGNRKTLQDSQEGRKRDNTTIER